LTTLNLQSWLAFAFFEGHSSKMEMADKTCVFMCGGVIACQENLLPVRELRPSPDHFGIKRWEYSPDLLKAIFFEKAGFGGMRLLVENEHLNSSTLGLVTERFKEQFLREYREPT